MGKELYARRNEEADKSSAGESGTDVGLSRGWDLACVHIM